MANYWDVDNWRASYIRIFDNKCCLVATGNQDEPVMVARLFVYICCGRISCF